MSNEEPDMQHPKIQNLLSSNARRNIELQLVDQLLEEGSDTDLTSMDMEYWNSTHDKLREALQDAERYRYLRNRIPDEVFNKRGLSAGCWIDCEDDTGQLALLTGDDADKDIDAAIAKGMK